MLILHAQKKDTHAQTDNQILRAAVYVNIYCSQNLDECYRYGTLGGGYYNYITGEATTIHGGYGNTVNEPYGTIGGGYYNLVNAEGASIAGGETNTVLAEYGSIMGGLDNYANR